MNGLDSEAGGCELQHAQKRIGRLADFAHFISFLHLSNQSISSSINQSINQSINRSIIINPSIIHSLHQHWVFPWCQLHTILSTSLHETLYFSRAHAQSLCHASYLLTERCCASVQACRLCIFEDQVLKQNCCVCCKHQTLGCMPSQHVSFRHLTMSCKQRWSNLSLNAWITGVQGGGV